MSDIHTATVPESRTPLIRYAVLALLVVWMAGYVGYKSAEAEKIAKADRVVAAAHPPALPTPPVYVPCQGEWGFQTLDIPEEGLLVYLCQGWKDWPKGGAITITPKGGEPLHDQPGMVNHFGYQPNGLYTIRADPAGSTRQVQLFNR
jgi:hypothetical protein